MEDKLILTEGFFEQLKNQKWNFYKDCSDNTEYIAFLKDKFEIRIKYKYQIYGSKGGFVSEGSESWLLAIRENGEHLHLWGESEYPEIREIYEKLHNPKQNDYMIKKVEKAYVEQKRKEIETKGIEDRRKALESKLESICIRIK